jgi:hypothetical protein
MAALPRWDVSPLPSPGWLTGQTVTLWNKVSSRRSLSMEDGPSLKRFLLLAAQKMEHRAWWGQYFEWLQI